MVGMVQLLSCKRGQVGTVAYLGCHTSMGKVHILLCVDVLQQPLLGVVVVDPLQLHQLQGGVLLPQHFFPVWSLLPSWFLFGLLAEAGGVEVLQK